jgi:hypothetical protein
MSEVRRHVLLWVAPEFLKSSGMVQVFKEAGIFSPPEDDLEEYIRSAIAAGGFAMTGRLAEAGHGAGIWISPVDTPGLELMVPWQFVKAVVTAESPQESKAFGLIAELVQPNGHRARKKQNERSKIRNNTGKRTPKGNDT